MPTTDQKAPRNTWKLHPGNDLTFTGRIKINTVLQDLTLGWDFFVTVVDATGTQVAALALGSGIELSMTLGEFLVTISGVTTDLLDTTTKLIFDLDVVNPSGSNRTYLIGTILSDTDNTNC